MLIGTKASSNSFTKRYVLWVGFPEVLREAFGILIKVKEEKLAQRMWHEFRLMLFNTFLPWKIIILILLSSATSIAQLSRGKMIPIDTVESYDDPKEKCLRYYYGSKEWDNISNQFSYYNIPYSSTGNQFKIYNLVGRNTSSDIFRLINIANDSLNNVSNEVCSGKYEKEFIYSFIPMVMNQCLSQIDTSKDKKGIKISITKPLSFFDCILQLYSRNSRRPRIDSIIFKKKFLSYATSYSAFYLKNVTFEDTCEFGFENNTGYFTQQIFTGIKDSKRVSFLNTTFNGICIIRNNTEEYSEYGDEYYQPLNPKIITLSLLETKDQPLSNIKFKNVVFNNQIIIHSSSLKNIDFDNTTFNSSFFLTDKKLDSITFRKCTFSTLIDLRGVSFLHGTSLANNFYKNNCNVIIRSNDEVEKLGFDIFALQKIFFVIDWDWNYPLRQYVYWDSAIKGFSTQACKGPFNSRDSIQSPLEDFSEKNLEQVRSKLQEIKDQIDKAISSNDLFGSDKQKAITWLNYQEMQYEKLYYKYHGTMHYYWLCFIEDTVNFGYQGEWLFLKFCLWIILGFSIIYRLWFRKDINYSITNESESDLDQSSNFGEKIKNKRSLSSFIKFFNIDFAKAIFISFSVFFNPRFPSAMFKNSQKFVWLIIIEWLLGLSFILLFLYFIAANYPIVSKLLGF